MMLGKKSQEVTIKLKLEGDKLTGTIGGGQATGKWQFPMAHSKTIKSVSA